MEIKWLLKFKEKVTPEPELPGPSSLWAAMDQEGRTPHAGALWQRPAPANAKTPAFVSLENSKHVFSENRTGARRGRVGRRQSSEQDSDKPGPWQKTLGGLFCSCGACGMSRRTEPEAPGHGHQRALTSAPVPSPPHLTFGGAVPTAVACLRVSGILFSCLTMAGEAGSNHPC